MEIRRMLKTGKKTLASIYAGQQFLNRKTALSVGWTNRQPPELELCIEFAGSLNTVHIRLRSILIRYSSVLR